MQRGIIGVPSQSSDRLTTVEPYHDTRQEYGQTLHSAIDPQTQETLTGDVEFIEGRALKESVDEATEYRYNTEQETIDSVSVRTKVQETAGFVAVPATDDHNGFGMVTSSDGEFALQLLGHADLSPMERATIDLGDLYFDHQDEFNVQTGGGSSDCADTIMAWGDNLDDDESIDQAFAKAARANTLPQLAGSYVSDTIGHRIRVNIAASGYIEVWDPDISTYEFLNLVRSEIMPYVESVEGTSDKSEKAAADPNQSGLEAYDGDADEAETDGEDDWVPGECEECEHERDRTQFLDGRRVCIICHTEDQRE